MVVIFVLRRSLGDLAVHTSLYRRRVFHCLLS